MRWDRLFADVEALAQADEHMRFDADVQDRTRAEHAGVDLAARLLTAVGSELAVTTTAGETVRSHVVDACAQWLLMGATGPQELIPTAAIAQVVGLPRQVSDVGEVTRRLGLGFALRALARDRVRVVVHAHGVQLAGLLGVVGADYVEVNPAVGPVVVVPMSAITRVRSAL